MMVNSLGLLETRIDESRVFLSWHEDWDDAGAVAYHQETWERVVGFLRLQAERLLQRWSLIMVPPRILPGPDGNIDLHWCLGPQELLIEIPDTPHALAPFYGDTRPLCADDQKCLVKGTLDLSQPQDWLFLWLMQGYA
jgi:hypothetical protein